MSTARQLRPGTTIEIGHPEKGNRYRWRVLKVESIYVFVCADWALHRHEKWKLKDLRQWMAEGFARIGERQ